MGQVAGSVKALRRAHREEVAEEPKNMDMGPMSGDDEAQEKISELKKTHRDKSFTRQWHSAGGTSYCEYYEKEAKNMDMGPMSGNDEAQDTITELMETHPDKSFTRQWHSAGGTSYCEYYEKEAQNIDMGPMLIYTEAQEKITELIKTHPDKSFTRHWYSAGGTSYLQYYEKDAFEFTVVIGHSVRQRLGVRINPRTLQISAVTGGHVQRWNEDHPELAVKPRDIIVEVNGIRNDVPRLVEELQQHNRKVLKMVVRRQAEAPPPLDLEPEVAKLLSIGPIHGQIVEVRVRGISGRPLCNIRARSGWTVDRLKKHVADEARIPIKEQRLLCGTSQLSDQDSLSTVASLSPSSQSGSDDGSAARAADITLVRTAV